MKNIHVFFFKVPKTKPDPQIAQRTSKTKITDTPLRRFCNLKDQNLCQQIQSQVLKLMNFQNKKAKKPKKGKKKRLVASPLAAH